MIEWWTALSTMMKILWALTLSVSLIFVIQTVLTFLGIAGDSDFDINVSDVDAGALDMDSSADHGTGMGLLTFRNFVNFFLGFGWSAILLHESISSTAWLMIISVVIGIALVTAVMMLFKWLGSMQQSGNINIRTQAAGCTGKVYLAIPAGRAASGKVQININNAVREYDAVTDGDALPTGSAITVVDYVSENLLLVEAAESVII